jgi:hypothetical protein
MMYRIKITGCMIVKVSTQIPQPGFVHGLLFFVLIKKFSFVLQISLPKRSKYDVTGRNNRHFRVSIVSMVAVTLPLCLFVSF